MATTGQKVSGAIAWTLVPRVVQMAGGIFTSILIVRTLGEFDYGTLSVLRTVLIYIVVICGFGMGQALNRFVPELRIVDMRRSGRLLLYRAILVQSGVWLLVCLMLLAAGPRIREAYPTYAEFLLLGVLLSIFQVMAGTFTQYAVASYRTREMALATALGTAVLAASTVVVLRIGLRVDGVLIATAVGYGATILGMMALLARSRQPGGVSAPVRAVSGLPDGAGTAADPQAAPGPDSRHFPWRRLMAYAVPWVPNNLLNFVVWRQSETLLLGIFKGRELAGFFDLAYKLPQMLLEFVPGAVYPVVLAGFAETATMRLERMRNAIYTYYQLLFFVVAPLCVLGLALGDVLLVKMYGSHVAQAGPYCQAFFVIFTLSFFGTPLSMAVYVMEKVWINLLLNVAYGIVTVGLDLILIPRYGLLGATIPTGIVTALTPFVRYWIAKRYMGDIRLPWSFLGRVFLASAPLLGLFWLKQYADTWRMIFLLMAGSAAVTLLFYRILRVLGPEERAFLADSRVPFKEWLLKIL